MFSATRCKMEYVDEIVDLFLDSEGSDLQLSQYDATKVRAVTRLLLSPKRADSSLLRKKFEIGLSDNPCEALVLSHHDRLVSNIRLLRSTYGFIPPARAPPVSLSLSSVLTLVFALLSASGHLFSNLSFSVKILELLYSGDVFWLCMLATYNHGRVG